VPEIAETCQKLIEHLSPKCRQSETGHIMAGYEYPYDAEMQAVRSYLSFSIGRTFFYLPSDLI